MKNKKLVGPIIVTILGVGYFSFFILGVLNIPDLIGFKFFGILAPLVLMGYLIFALLDRIEEIRKGEDDDLSNY